jgi:hypothetical protein
VSAVIVLIFATSLWSFIVAAILTSLSWAANSGTNTALLHNTTEALGVEKDFTKINMNQQSYSALYGVALFTLVPLLAGINIKLPFIASLLIDSVGLFVALTLTPPPIQKYTDIQPISLFKIIKQLWSANFLPFALFIASVSSVMLASNRFVYPYIEELGMPAMYVGLITATVGIVQFSIGKFMSNHIHKVKISHIFLTDILIFPISFLIIAFTGNFWIVAILIVARAGYARVRRPFTQSYVLDNFVSDKRYKATVLSVLGQIRVLMASAMLFIVSPIIGISYKTGFIMFGIGIFVLLSVTFGMIRIYEYATRKRMG